MLPGKASKGSSRAAPPAATPAEGSTSSGTEVAQCPDSQQAEYSPAGEPTPISSGKGSVPQGTYSTEAANPRHAGSAHLSLAVGSAAAPSKPLQLEVTAPSTPQSSAVQPPKTPAGAAPGAARPLGSFLSKSLAEASAARASYRTEQLSTRQAQGIADAAAAGTYVHKQTGSVTVQEGQLSSMSRKAMPSSTAAALPNAIENLRASTLQPPKTSEHAPLRCVVEWCLHSPKSLLKMQARVMYIRHHTPGDCHRRWNGICHHPCFKNFGDPCRQRI